MYDKLDIANTFNDFYINVGPKLANDIDVTNVNIDIDTHLKDVNVCQSMYIKPTNEHEITQIINSFKNKSSEDINGISMKLIKQVKDLIVKPLTHICNVSLQKGEFPNKMKVAKVLPLYKSNDEHNVSNYRPVSILPQFSKILENFFEKRLREFVKDNNLLFNGQYGFRTNRSTSFALNEMVDTIVKAIDNNKFCIGVFIDLKRRSIP